MFTFQIIIKNKNPIVLAFTYFFLQNVSVCVRVCARAHMEVHVTYNVLYILYINTHET